MSYQAERWTHAQRELHRTPSAVLANLAGRVKHRTLECWPSQQTIADDLRMSRRTVCSALEYLEQQGFITRERQHRRETGYRAQDRITLRMESVQTVVQITQTYGEYLAERHPSRYTHRAANVNGRLGLCERRSQQEQEEVNGKRVPTPTSSSSRSTQVEEKSSMHIRASRIDGEWNLTVVGIDLDYDQNRVFKQVLADILSAALDGGVTTETLTRLLQDSWEVSEHWVGKLEEFERRVSAHRGCRNYVPGLSA